MYTFAKVTILSFLCFVILKIGAGVPLEEFYSYGELAGDHKLLQKDEGSTPELELQTPFVFYGDTYFSLFININGLVSFLTEIPYFFNSQFPLDYPVIAPFYSDVDTTGAGTIYYRETSDPTTVEEFSNAVKENFENDEEFIPESVYIVTWDRVSSFQARRDKLNTFQVVMGSNRKDSYVILNYADGGLQWLQGDGKTSGLPDALGQAGFIADDGRLFTIRGSGTDQVRNLDKWSNIDKPGVWIYKVGRIHPGKNVEPPNKHTDTEEGHEDYYEEFSEDGASCATGGSICHSSALCNDFETGFCCSCKEGFYGNGVNCLSVDTPIRVTGKLSGAVNGVDIVEADLHSYVLSSEGRTYTAVSRIPKGVGYDLQSLTGIGEGIAWLFAIPKEGVLNGFSITGGVLNRTVEMKFPQTGHKAIVEQTFTGLDVFNNVAVRTKVSGSLPTIPIGSELEVEAFNEEFTRVKAGQIRAHSSRTFRLKSQSIETPYTVETFINFNECEHAPRNSELDTLRMKVAENIFIRYDEAESIVRYSFSAKIGTLEEVDPCLKGRDECGANSLCIVDEDNFRCVCEQGYYYVFESTRKQHVCLDINECDIGRELCHDSAVCINSEGSYTCQCKVGYSGDGYYCNPDITCHNAGCDPNASCQEINGEPECHCNVGYKGDGFFCTPDFGHESCHFAQNCSPYAVCAPTTSGYSCRCLHGYRGDGYVCEVDRYQPRQEYEDSEIQGPFFPIDEDVPQVTLRPILPEPLPSLRPYEYDPYRHPKQEIHEEDEDEAHGTHHIDDDGHDNEDDSHGPKKFLSPECLLGICYCQVGYDYDSQTGHCVLAPEEESHDFDDKGNPQPSCDSDKCTCPPDYIYNPIYHRCDTISEAPPCNVINNCPPNAQCLYRQETGESHCTCNAGFTGDGYFCSPLDISCDEVDICHFNADCVYDDNLLKSVCVCKPGYSGDGLVCTPQDDCSSSSECHPNAQCAFDSLSQRYVCKCTEGFEGDGFYCSLIPVESCLTRQDCSPDATCEYVPFNNGYECHCHEGFEGDGFYCNKIELTCNIVNNCGLNADCSYDELSGGFKCKCRTGYSGDGFFCRTLRSCLQDPSICHPDAMCQRSSTDEYHHECVCLPGFTGEGSDCQKNPEHEKNILFVNQGLSVLRLPVDPNVGNGYPIHVDPYMTAVGADVDCLEGLYYWTDVGSRSIRSSKYDGSSRRPLLSGGKIGSPEDVAVDWVSRNIYWTDSSSDVVRVSNIEGSLVRTVIEGDLVNPRGITIHPGLGFLFWSDWNRNKPKIERSGMDGSDRKELVSGIDVSLPNSLVVDFETSTLCWADAGTHRIECIGIQGYGRQIIIEGIKYPFGLTLHKHSFYYTDWNDTRIHEVSRYSGLEERSLIPPLGGSGKLYGIASVPEQCPPVSNVCQSNRGNCPETHLCLPNGRGGRSCSCPNSESDEDHCTDF